MIECDVLRISREREMFHRQKIVTMIMSCFSQYCHKGACQDVSILHCIALFMGFLKSTDWKVPKTGGLF